MLPSTQEDHMLDKVIKWVFSDSVSYFQLAGLVAIACIDAAYDIGIVSVVVLLVVVAVINIGIQVKRKDLNLENQNLY